MSLGPAAAQPGLAPGTSRPARVPQMAVWPSGVMRSAAQDTACNDDGPEKMTRLAAIRSPLGAVLTVFFGYEIFIAGWYGTFADFFAAFLWGFFGQFGLERLRDLAKPVTAKALP